MEKYILNDDPYKLCRLINRELSGQVIEIDRQKVVVGRATIPEKQVQGEVVITGTLLFNNRHLDVETEREIFIELGGRDEGCGLAPTDIKTVQSVEIARLISLRKKYTKPSGGLPEDPLIGILEKTSKNK